jgi:hypothetical protein
VTVCNATASVHPKRSFIRVYIALAVAAPAHNATASCSSGSVQCAYNATASCSSGSVQCAAYKATASCSSGSVQCAAYKATASCSSGSVQWSWSASESVKDARKRTRATVTSSEVTGV